MGERRPAHLEAGNALVDHGIVTVIAERSGHLIGLWADDPGGLQAGPRREPDVTS